MKYKFLFVILLSIISILGCDLSKQENNTDFIKINSINLAPERILKVGENININATISYSLNANKGKITLLAQKSDQTPPNLAYETKEVLKGKGTLDFNISFEVPNTKEVQIFIDLRPENSTFSSINDHRFFKVTN